MWKNYSIHKCYEHCATQSQLASFDKSFCNNPCCYTMTLNSILYEKYCRRMGYWAAEGGCQGYSDMWQGLGISLMIPDMSPWNIPQLAVSRCWENGWFHSYQRRGVKKAYQLATRNCVGGIWLGCMLGSHLINELLFYFLLCTIWNSRVITIGANHTLYTLLESFILA